MRGCDPKEAAVCSLGLLKQQCKLLKQPVAACGVENGSIVLLLLPSNAANLFDVPQCHSCHDRFFFFFSPGFFLA